MAKNAINILAYILALFVIGLSLKIYLESDAFNLKCIISDLDGNKYCVRERKRINEAADILATVMNKCEKLIEYLVDKYPNDERVKRLHQKFDKTKCVETLPTSELTAYSENKGEKVAFCLNKKKNGTKLIDINTLTFVALHEISHIGTETIGHKKDFWKKSNFSK